LRDGNGKRVGPQIDYVVYSPQGPVQDFTALTCAKAVLNLWAGVERVVGNQTLTQPLCRMVDAGLERGMVDYVTGHVLRYHLGIDATLFTRNTSDVVSAINISTKSGANDALAVLDSAIDKVASQRGDLGAQVAEACEERLLARSQRVESLLRAGQDGVVARRFGPQRHDRVRIVSVDRVGGSRGEVMDVHGVSFDLMRWWGEPSARTATT